MFYSVAPGLALLPLVLASPSRDDARESSEALLLPFSEYRFEDMAAGKALVLGGLSNHLHENLAAAELALTGTILASLTQLADNTLRYERPSSRR